MTMLEEDSNPAMTRMYMPAEGMITAMTAIKAVAMDE